MPTPPQPQDEAPQATALKAALQQLLQPLASLAVANGLPCAQVEGMLQEAFIEAASQAHPDLLPHRMVSRISTTTGLNRRLVTRVLSQDRQVRQQRRQPASELRVIWLTTPRYLERRGRPRVLPRQGSAPSFESLAAELTKDVHPRSLLDEMVRLGLATHDAAADTVALVADAYAPKADALRLMGFLGDNVGDHLRAAVANVQGGGGLHLERAMFADGLSAQSVQEMDVLVREQWQKLVEALVPELRQRIERDTAASGAATVANTKRLRVGMYSFQDEANSASEKDDQ